MSVSLSFGWEDVIVMRLYAVSERGVGATIAGAVYDECAVFC